ncbi:MAG: hypothetical protein IPJ40_14520 [Saprospirales bacterium]|nr:hypothetical protein [Saprospirales bacterium]
MVLITSQGSSLGADITYQWTLNNNLIATGLGSWVATQPGEYCLHVINENNGCVSQACDSLVQLIDPPLVYAGPDTALTCGITSLLLSGSPGAVGNYTLAWTTADGCITSDPFVEMVTIECPGTYQLQVTDTITGCFAIDDLVVDNQTTPPVATILPPDPVTCAQPEIMLDGTTSLPLGAVTYSWFTPDGLVVGPSDGNTALAGLPGIYQLIVQDIFNLCADTTTAVVDVEVVYPVADAGPDTALTCFHPQLQLDGSGSSQGTKYTYAWTPPPGGTVASGANTLFPLIDQPGTYTLTVIDTTNFCTTTDEVVVDADILAPQAVIDLSVPPLITCTQEEIPLSGLLSTPVGLLTFSWQTTGGQIQGDLSEAEVNALSGGTYFLTVQNQQNGCLDTAWVTVEENLLPPQIQLQIPNTLTCLQTTVILDASGTTASGSIGVVWTGPGPITDSLSLTPTVTQSGNYQVVVTDLDNGCMATDSLMVLQDTLAPQAQAFADGAFDCEVLVVGLNGSGSSVGALFSYSWSSQQEIRSRTATRFFQRYSSQAGIS